MNEDILVEYVFTMIDKDNLEYITFDYLKNFLEQSHVEMNDEEIKEMFDNLDKQKKGKISLKDFKKNFIAELRTFSTSNVNIINEDDEYKTNNISDISIDVGFSPSKIGANTITFSCIKEPRHEFFSTLKRKNRLMVFTEKTMI